MKKPKNKEPVGDSVEESTDPNIAVPDFGEGEDTAVTEAPVELLQYSLRPDDWDGPTHEAAEAEMAALAASSTEAEGSGEVDAEAELPASAPSGRLEGIIESLLFASDRPLP